MQHTRLALSALVAQRCSGVYSSVCLVFQLGTLLFWPGSWEFSLSVSLLASGFAFTGTSTIGNKV